MARKKAKALPPKMITVYAEILQETEKAILVRCDDDADGVWLPKSQIKYDGERGDEGVEIEIPELMADEKGFFDGMGRPAQSEPIPPAPDSSAEDDATPPDIPTIVLHGRMVEITEDYINITFTDSEGAEFEHELPLSEVCYDGDLQPGDSADFTISLSLAIDEGLVDAPEESQTEPLPDREYLDQETITVTQHLTEAEKSAYADEMAKLDEEIEEMEIERSEVSSRLKKAIDAKEEERRAMSRIIRTGKEEREIFCDKVADYTSCEIVWTDAHGDHAEVSRRKMTSEERQRHLPGLLPTEPPATTVDENAPATDADTDAEADVEEGVEGSEAVDFDAPVEAVDPALLADSTGADPVAAEAVQ
jgi:hypothetical protein